MAVNGLLVVKNSTLKLSMGQCGWHVPERITIFGTPKRWFFTSMPGNVYTSCTKSTGVRVPSNNQFHWVADTPPELLDSCLQNCLADHHKTKDQNGISLRSTTPSSWHRLGLAWASRGPRVCSEDFALMSYQHLASLQNEFLPGSSIIFHHFPSLYLILSRGFRVV